MQTKYSAVAVPVCARAIETVPSTWRSPVCRVVSWTIGGSGGGLALGPVHSPLDDFDLVARLGCLVGERDDPVDRAAVEQLAIDEGEVVGDRDRRDLGVDLDDEGARLGLDAGPHDAPALRAALSPPTANTGRTRTLLRCIGEG